MENKIEKIENVIDKFADPIYDQAVGTIKKAKECFTCMPKGAKSLKWMAFTAYSVLLSPSMAFADGDINALSDGIKTGTKKLAVQVLKVSTPIAVLVSLFILATMFFGDERKFGEKKARLTKIVIVYIAINSVSIVLSFIGGFIQDIGGGQSAVEGIWD